MLTITCDVCKKKIDDSFYGRNFFYFAGYSICEPCKDSLDSAIRPTIRANTPFTMGWYTKLVANSLDKAVQKGKI
jgi:hypothetical protein